LISSIQTQLVKEVGFFVYEKQNWRCYEKTSEISYF